MKTASLKLRRHRETGAALITVLMISLCTAMLLGASLTVALTSTELGWTQSYSQAALELADAGVNSEFQYVALNVSASLATGRSSQPVVYAGVTATLPGHTSTVLGRPGTVTGYSGGEYYVFSSNDAAGTTAWDGVTEPYYITCNAEVHNVWQTVQVEAESTSLFNVYGIDSTGDSSSSSTVTVGSGSSVTVTGSGGTNGTVSQGSNCTFTAPQCINYNCGKHSSGQFTNTNVCSGGQLCSCQSACTYPRTATCCGNCFGCAPGSSDATCFAACKSACCNSGNCYQYTSNASSNTICQQNCCKLSGGCGTGCLGNSCYSNCNTEPGTFTSSYSYWYGAPTTAVKTLIFEPGDYYFTGMQLNYDAACNIVVDPCAYASGGTPGQVRFWFYDPNSGTDGNPADFCQCPITCTCASGQSTPDPGTFRIYYGKDNCTCNFTRPSGVCDWTGNYCQGDFNYYCGFYGCCKPAGDTNSSHHNCCCCFNGCQHNNGCNDNNWGWNGNSNTGNGSYNGPWNCNLCGSMLCDNLSFTGCCNVNYTPSQCCSKDPCSGCSCQSWSCHGD